MKQRYNRILLICFIFFPPLAFGLERYYLLWKHNPTERNQRNLELALRIGIFFMLFTIIVISFMFYQFGRYPIHVMGTFY